MTLLKEFEENVKVVVETLEHLQEVIEQQLIKEDLDITQIKDFSVKTFLLKGLQEKGLHDISYSMFIDPLNWRNAFREITMWLHRYMPEYKSQIEQQYAKIINHFDAILSAQDDRQDLELVDLQREIGKLANDLRYCAEIAREESIVRAIPEQIQEEEKQEEEKYENFLQDIAEKVGSLIIEYDLAKARFQEQIKAFRKIVNQTNRKYIRHLKKAESNEQYQDYGDGKPPEKGWIWDKDESVWRPDWFFPEDWVGAYFGWNPCGLLYPGPVKEPQGNERLICEYALLAVLHDVDPGYKDSGDEVLEIPACDRLYFIGDNDPADDPLTDALELPDIAEKKIGKKVRRRIRIALEHVKDDLVNEQAKKKPKEKNGQSKNWHNEDFTEVLWNGKQYKFDKPQQTLSVKYLWENKRGREKSIGEAIGSEADNFRLIHIFRQRSTKSKMHPAWGTMIIPDGKGIYALAERKKATKN